LAVAGSLLDLIGKTPLVKLARLTGGEGPTILAKLEFLNPGGSVKDRIGLAMILDAERRGLIEPGYTIVEPTSGNTGMGLALASILRGYKVIFTVPEKMSKDKVDLLRAVGAKVVVTSSKVPPGHAANYVQVAKKIASRTPHSFIPNQYQNLANPEAHYATTGPEIWEQTGGRVDVLVAGVGTDHLSALRLVFGLRRVGLLARGELRHPLRAEAVEALRGLGLGGRECERTHGENQCDPELSCARTTQHRSKPPVSNGAPPPRLDRSANLHIW